MQIKLVATVYHYDQALIGTAHQQRLGVGGCGPGAYTIQPNQAAASLGVTLPALLPVCLPLTVHSTHFSTLCGTSIKAAQPHYQAASREACTKAQSQVFLLEWRPDSLLQISMLLNMTASWHTSKINPRALQLYPTQCMRRAWESATRNATCTMKRHECTTTSLTRDQALSGEDRSLCRVQAFFSASWAEVFTPERQARVNFQRDSPDEQSIGWSEKQAGSWKSEKDLQSFKMECWRTSTGQ